MVYDRRGVGCGKTLAHEKVLAAEVGSGGAQSGGQSVGATSPAIVALAWLAVGIPLGWGVYRTLLSVGKMFA